MSRSPLTRRSLDSVDSVRLERLPVTEPRRIRGAGQSLDSVRGNLFDTCEQSARMSKTVSLIRSCGLPRQQGGEPSGDSSWEAVEFGDECGFRIRCGATGIEDNAQIARRGREIDGGDLW